MIHRGMVGLLAGMILGILAAGAAADRVTLKDGTILEGTAIKQSDGYWIKTADGESRQIPNDQIASVEKSRSATGAPGEAAHASPNFAAVQRRANAVDSPMAAVAIWQQYIDSSPNADDLKSAREQLANWKKLADSGAEKINGRWVGGDERKEMLEKAGKLAAEADEMLRKSQTLAAVKKLEEADKAYPNSFAVNFLLGQIAVLEHDADKAMPRFERALTLKPNAPEALADMALAFYEKKQFEKAIQLTQQAAEVQDSAQIALNLNSMITLSPESLRHSPRLKPAVEAARLLASKYNLPEAAAGKLVVLGLRPESTRGDALVPAPAGMMSGTGFVINADGLILTNRHVIKGAKTTMVVVDSGKQKSAEVVAVDDEQDLALIRILKPDPDQAYVRLAPTDTPPDGAECTVIGYPLIDRLGANAKITRGIVSSAGRQMGEVDVVIDAKVNPGNSGGPILDKHGNVMAIVCMKSLASTTEESYGLGISAGRIRRFLAKNKIAVEKAPATDAAPLSAEEIAAKVKPATVCILSTM